MKQKEVISGMTLAREMFMNSFSLTRRTALSKLFDPRRDIDDECGYPKEITPDIYKALYEREGIAKRVVVTYPEECWARNPEIKEDDKPEDSEFEKAWQQLEEKLMLFHYLQRIDDLSGIGRFGVLLLGFDDGEDLAKPVEGIDEKGEKVGNTARELLFLRPFDESQVSIKARETNTANPRYGYPTVYTIRFETIEGTSSETQASTQTKDIHWTRIIHIADNRKTSEVFGTPRLEAVYNRIYDLRKILSGSGEMFWKGAFPGYAFEINPDVSDAEIDQDTLREEFADYADGLQRYIALNGLKVNSLAPQVADPTGHVDNQLRAIAITVGIPKRILEGSERGELASSQDKRSWNERLAARQEKYLSPLVIRPLVDRLIAVGTLPEVEEYIIEWPDLNTTTDEEIAKVAEIKTKALAAYIKGGVDMIIPPQQYLTEVLKMETKQAEDILKEAEKQIKLTEDEEDLTNPPESVPPVPAEEQE